MSRNLIVPYFPEAPQDYDQSHMSQLIRAFALFAAQVANPGEGRNTFTVFTNLQENDFGLEIGAVYRHGNELRIVLANISAPAGVSSTGGVGSVTVTTT